MSDQNKLREILIHLRSGANAEIDSDIDEAEQAILKFINEVIDTPLSVEYDDPIGSAAVIARLRELQRKRAGL